MANPRTNSLSLARPRTRNMPQKSFTSAMKRGVASSVAKLPPRHRPTSFRCMLFCFVPRRTRSGGTELTLAQSEHHQRALPRIRQAGRPHVHKPTSRLQEAASCCRPC
jgi:hypothetical protein